MESQKKTKLALLITVVILIAVFSSFGQIFFQGGTPEVVLPVGTAQPGETQPVGGGAEMGDGQVVAVTPDTVQSVLATLARPESYYREMTLETFWGEDRSSTATAKVWVDDGFTRVDTELADGTVEHTIVGDGTRYRWYDREREWFSAPAREEDSDVMQRIPTYEDILALDPADIIATGYERKNDVDCVYAEVRQEELGYRERYWVSVEWGLLVAAETVKEEQVVLRVSAYSVEIPVREGAVFTLPNGRVLHSAR